MRTKDCADVVIMPPILFLAALVLGYALTYYFPIGPGLALPNAKGLTVGLVFMVAGLALAIFPARRLRRAGASVMPGQPATVLVEEGAYRVTRNPMYIGLVLIYFGLSIALTSGWILLLLIPVLLILHRGVVLREEAYLKWKFGDKYRAYMERVPRWL